MRPEKCLVTLLACVHGITASVLSSQAYRHHEGKVPGTIFQDELNLIQRSLGALERWSDKPDCFRVAAKRVSSQCGDADMDEKQRIITSISMTLCEIATGSHYSIPLECQIFSSLAPSSSPPPPPTGDAVDASRCVDALSRSTQFWSSYSGYLREMPQLCYAFRQWNEVDLAKDLYQNATLEKIELLNLLLTRERGLEALVGAWRSHADTLSAQTELAADRFDSLYGLLSKKLLEVVGEVTTSIQAETSDLIRRRDESENNIREIMADRFRNLVHVHTAYMEAAKTDLGVYTQRLQGDFLDIFAVVEHRTAEILDDLGFRWRESRSLVDEIQLLSKQVILDNQRLSGSIFGLVDQTEELRNQQSLIFSQYSVLSSKTNELTEMAQIVLHEINETMVDMKAAYTREEPSRNDRLWQPCATWILKKLLHFDTTSAEEFVRIPLLGGLAAVVGTLASILRVGASASMSTIVVLYLTSRHLVTRLITVLSVSKANFVRGSSNSLTEEPPKLEVYGPTLAQRVAPAAEAESRNHLEDYRSNGRIMSLGNYRRAHRGRVSRIPDWLCQSKL